MKKMEAITNRSVMNILRAILIQELTYTDVLRLKITKSLSNAANDFSDSLNFS